MSYWDIFQYVLTDCYETALLFSSRCWAIVEAGTSVLQWDPAPTEIDDKAHNYGTGFHPLCQNGALDMLATASRDNIKL